MSPLSKSVGRPREFDEDTVLIAAMDAFWARGYEATSMADLCQCTGLHKGSLYQSFGDKHQLFMKALQHYIEVEFREVAAAAFQSESPLANIRAAVHQICDMAGHEKGCMMVNSMVEMAPHDPEVKVLLRQTGEKRLRVMSEMIAKAQDHGEINRAGDPDMMARQLMLTLAGAAAAVKGFMDHDEILAVIEGLIDSWV